MAIENDRRLMLELDKHRRDINRKFIRERVDNLNLEKIKPIVEMVARTRAAYLAELFDLASIVGNESPSKEQIEKLSFLRMEFKELLDAANALETAIERNYVDVLDK